MEGGREGGMEGDIRQGQTHMTRDHNNLYYRIENLRFNSFSLQQGRAGVWTQLFKIKSFYFDLSPELNVVELELLHLYELSRESKL